MNYQNIALKFNILTAVPPINLFPFTQGDYWFSLTHTVECIFQKQSYIISVYWLFHVKHFWKPINMTWFAIN